MITGNKIIIAMFLFGLPVLSYGDYLVDALVKDICALPQKPKTMFVGSVVTISGEENDATKLYKEQITTALVQQCSSMAVLDRGSLKEETGEIALSQSGATSDQVELQEGKLLNAQMLLNVIVVQLKQGTEVSGKLVDVQTSQIVFAKAYRDFNDEKPKTTTPADKSEQADKPNVEYIQVTAAQQEQAIGFQNRGKMNGEEINYQAKLYNLRMHKPLEYGQVVEARKGFDYIARNEGLSILFYTLYAPSREYLQKTHPRVLKICLNRFAQIKRNKPGKIQFVNGYINLNAPVISREPFLAREILGACKAKVDEWHTQWIGK
ncbi:MAG: hypothetical protein WBM07_18380 [Chitinivibrionales bacterium]